MEKKNLDWANLGFGYVKTDKRFVSNYKFARIKYYTDIAAKGNNIKFLRGWIYRVLKEK